MHISTTNAMATAGTCPQLKLLVVTVHSTVQSEGTSLLSGPWMYLELRKLTPESRPLFPQISADLTLEGFLL